MEYFIGAFSKYVDFSGRARRKEYWNFILFYMLISFAVGIVSGVLGTMGMELIARILSVVTMIASLGIIVPSLSIAARRLHDTGLSGWMQLVAIIPVIGWILVIIWMVQDGEGENQYGENPKMIEA